MLDENGATAQARQTFETVAAAARAAHDTAAEAEADAFAGNIDYANGENQRGAELTERALKLSQTVGVPASVRVWSEIYHAQNRENTGFRSDENVRLLAALSEGLRRI